MPWLSNENACIIVELNALLLVFEDFCSDVIFDAVIWTYNIKTQKSLFVKKMKIIVSLIYFLSCHFVVQKIKNKKLV